MRWLGWVALVVVLAGCADGGDRATDAPASGDPRTTVQAYVDLALDGDCEGTKQYLTERLRAHFTDVLCDALSTQADTLEVGDAEALVKVGAASVSGDSALVPVSFGVEGGTAVTANYAVVVEGGRWLIASLGDPQLSPDAPTPTRTPTPVVPSGIPDPGIPTGDVTELDPSDAFPGGVPTNPFDDLPEVDPSDFPTIPPPDVPQPPESVFPSE